LLRDPRCVSTVEELATGSFQETIDDTINKADVKTLVFCTIMTLPLREKIMVVKTFAVVRIEQLFPPVEQLKAIIAQYPMMITFGQKNQRIWGLQLYVNEFRLVKWRLASLKRMQHQPREVIQEQNAVMLML
jgi:2-oxoglutarate dehydrogenase E1 component